MTRQARLDAPGALHHVMGRGIDGIEIFINKNDRDDFLGRWDEMGYGAYLYVDSRFCLRLPSGGHRCYHPCLRLPFASVRLGLDFAR